MPDARALARLLCDTLTGDQLSHLRSDPIAAIPSIVPEITVTVVDDEPGDGCSIEGLYQQATRTILVRRAMSGRRTKFTAIHEFGHDRARNVVDVARRLASMRVDVSRRFEERIADAFAAAVLIPDAAVDSVLDGERPTARHVVDLFHRTDVDGSREACSVRLAQRMTGDGYVVIIEGSTLRFCASVGGAARIARDADQSDVGLFRRARQNGIAVEPEARLQFPDGRFTGQFGAQAVQDGEYTFAVFTDATSPPWGGAWTPPRSRVGDAPEIVCDECDEVTEAWERCVTDPEHRICGICGWCTCRRTRGSVPHRTCDVCGSTKRADLFDCDGTVCCDCT